jgi:fibronectin type 3 domain-containing protein
MKKVALLLCVLGLFRVSCYAQTASGQGSITGAGSIMLLAGHSVTLTWTASGSSGVTGYNVFRSQTSGGPYTQLNSSQITGTSYVDTSVTAGQTYYYVATAVSSGGQSSYSNQASATVP